MPVGPRRLIPVALAIAAGLAIGLVDSSPGWDSTGITAGMLVLAAAVFAGLAGDRPWLWALLIGLPTPILELPAGGPTGSLLAIGFAGLGAFVGWGVARSARGSAQGPLRK